LMIKDKFSLAYFVQLRPTSVYEDHKNLQSENTTFYKLTKRAEKTSMTKQVIFISLKVDFIGFTLFEDE